MTLIVLKSAIFVALILPVGLHSQIMVDTVAGGGSAEGMPAAFASLNSSTVGPDGSVYFATRSSIWQIATDGLLHAFAGTGESGFSGDGGPAIKATLWAPTALAVDHEGNLLFGDRNRIRRVSRAGVITTIAGNGLSANKVSDGPALAISVTPSHIAADSGGNIYFTEQDSGNQGYIWRARKLSPDGMISSLPGLDRPQYLAVDPGDNLYTAYQLGAVQKTTPYGVVSTITAFFTHADAFVIGAFSGLVVDVKGNIYVSSIYPNFLERQIHRLSPDGSVSLFLTGNSDVIGADAASNLYTISTGNSSVVRVSPSGASSVPITRSAPFSSPDGSAARGAILGASQIGVDSLDRLVFMDAATCRVRAVDDNGLLRTIAGTGKCGGTAAAGPALATDLCVSQDMTVGGPFVSIACPDGTLTRLDATGNLTVAAYSNPCLFPSLHESALDSQGVFYCSDGNTVFRVANDGKKTVLGGIQPRCFTNDCFWAIRAVAVDSTSRLYVLANSSRHNSVYTWDGAAFDGAPGLGEFEFAYNFGSQIVIDRSGQFYLVTDTGLSRSFNYGLSRVGMTGGFSGDGGTAQAARFTPSQVTVDSKGDVYVYDSGRIRKLTGSPPVSAPAIAPNGVVNPASYVGGVVSPGQIISIFGEHLASGTATFTLDDIMIDPVLLSTRVLYEGTPLPVLSVSPGQVNAVLPQNLNIVSELQVEVDGVRSLPVTIQNAAANPGFFTADGSGSGPGAIVNQDGTINSAVNPAPRGTTVSFFGTGAGATGSSSPDGYLDVAAPYGPIVSPVSVSIGGQPATVAYAGGAPFLVTGVFQINATIPVGIAVGSVDVNVLIGPIASKTVKLWTR